MAPVDFRKVLGIALQFGARLDFIRQAFEFLGRANGQACLPQNLLRFARESRWQAFLRARLSESLPACPQSLLPGKLENLLPEALERRARMGQAGGNLGSTEIQ
jgi:hypothetical protein